MDFHYQNVTQNNGQQALILKIFSPKQVLKNYCHHNKYNGPIYFLVHEEKINVQKHYTVQLMINNEVVAKATGLSRRIAEFMAAQKAISDIGKHDATIFNFIKKDRYGKINRSYSAGYLSQTDRTDSFASVTTSHCPSASPSIDAIDSMTIESNFSNVQNTNGETSSDEGVFVEGSESSSAVPSPRLEMKEKSEDKAQGEKRSKSKFNFLSSLSLINSLRAISRKPFRRNTFDAKKFVTYERTLNQNEENSTASRPTSSSSSSSAFSSNSSISSSTVLPSVNQEDLSNEDVTLINPGLITQSIIEEEEEDNDETENGAKPACDNNNSDYKELRLATKSSEILNDNSNAIAASSSMNNVNQGLIRSLSSTYPLSNTCSHNHFSIYGTLLCNRTNSSSNRVNVMDSNATALLFRYCCRMYLPLPYYDIRFESKFFAICRIILSVRINQKPAIEIPKSYENYEFTAKGEGDDSKAARNQAAQTIIDQLKAVDLFYDN